ncbi:ATP-binding cassette domain-containing protein [Nocardioides sp. 503]|uniref:ATP-binding cassette domain-containing protein n=1 Tax=Nocardioides sp. 503 TaxID=2508326 RepID=UPI00106FF125|nr:ATP-binding cassette domain-containing protein [Nocardioides sp. 503]
MSAPVTLRGVSKHFGGVRAVHDVDLEVAAGSAVAVIGPNGAGKSTILKLISGTHRPTTGEITVGEHRVDRLPGWALARRGVGVASQIPRPFRDLTVRQNVSVATQAARRGADVDEVLARTGLTRHAARPAGSLGVLDLKRLEVARALGCAPDVVLLDEIAAGLVGRELDEAIELVRSVHASGITTILVEHVEAVVRSLAERVVVMNWGEVLADGTPAEIAADERVREIYLGEAAPAAAAARADDRPAAPPLLSVSGLRAGYGRQAALHGVDLEIGEGEVIAVLGANGAGKSTLCAAISGVVPAFGGSIRMAGTELVDAPSYRRNRAGIAHCMEGRRLFVDLTVRENLVLGAPSSLPLVEVQSRIDALVETFPPVGDKLASLAGSLSGGQQQMVAVARALMSGPRLLVCDEVSLGLAPKVVDELYAALRDVHALGTAILLVEQNVSRCLDLADRAYVLNRGRISFSGDPHHLGDQNALDAAYFGTSEDVPSELQQGSV